MIILLLGPIDPNKKTNIQGPQELEGTEGAPQVNKENNQLDPSGNGATSIYNAARNFLNRTPFERLTGLIAQRTVNRVVGGT
ncbi:MAG: hypothetical protein HY094_09910, partial [Candidatus Melainabacteria bacterium]|nr:hypothetical protein [Candidatus Melainabacteria bacterium]